MTFKQFFLTEGINYEKYINKDLVRKISQKIYFDGLKRVTSGNFKQYRTDYNIKDLYNQQSGLKPRQYQTANRVIHLIVRFTKRNVSTSTGAWIDSSDTIIVNVPINRAYIKMDDIIDTLEHEVYHAVQDTFLFGYSKTLTGYGDKYKVIDPRKNGPKYYAQSPWEFKTMMISLVNMYKKLLTPLHGKYASAGDVLKIITDPKNTKLGNFHGALDLMKRDNPIRYRQFLKELYQELVKEENKVKLKGMNKS